MHSLAVERGVEQVHTVTEVANPLAAIAGKPRALCRTAQDSILKTSPFWSIDSKVDEPEGFKSLTDRFHSETDEKYELYVIRSAA